MDSWDGDSVLSPQKDRTLLCKCGNDATWRVTNIDSEKTSTVCGQCLTDWIMSAYIVGVLTGMEP